MNESGDTSPRPQSTASRWSGWDLVFFGAFVALTLVGVGVGVKIFLGALGAAKLTAIQVIALTAAFDLLLVGCIAFIAKVAHGRSFWEAMNWSHGHGIPIGFLISLGALLAVVALIVSSLFPPKTPPPIEELLTSRDSLYAIGVFSVLIGPLLEEFIFRGFVFGVLSELWGDGFAIPSSALLFALVHMPQLWGSWAGVIMILVVGYVLSAARARTHSLIPSFVIHTAYNAAIFGFGLLASLVEGGRKINL